MRRIAPILTSLGLLLLLTAQTPGVGDDGQATQDAPFPDRFRNSVSLDGPEVAGALLVQFKDRQSEAADSARDAIISMAVEDFQGDERNRALGLMEGVKVAYPLHPTVLGVLGQFYWYTNDRPECIENFRTLLRVDPENQMASRFLDLLFFVPDDFTVPELLVTDRFTIRPLGSSYVDLDYRAVMENVDHLRGVFGPDDDWPADDLTLEDDLRALTNHEREHEQRSAFTYTVLNHEESEVLGCIYLLPVHDDDYDVQVFYWTVEEASRQGWEEELGEDLREWLTDEWPFRTMVFPGRDMDWDTYNRLFGEE